MYGQLLPLHMHNSISLSAQHDKRTFALSKRKAIASSEEVVHYMASYCTRQSGNLPLENVAAASLVHAADGIGSVCKTPESLTNRLLSSVPLETAPVLACCQCQWIVAHNL